MRLTADLQLLDLPEHDPRHMGHPHGYAGQMDIPDGTQEASWDLYAVTSPGAPVWFRLHLSHIKGLAQLGWARCWVGVASENGSPLSRGPMPLAFYTGEPTDMPTGVVRLPLGESYDWRTQQWAPSSAVALLSIRRSR